MCRLDGLDPIGLRFGNLAVASLVCCAYPRAVSLVRGADLASHLHNVVVGLSAVCAGRRGILGPSLRRADSCQRNQKGWENPFHACYLQKVKVSKKSMRCDADRPSLPADGGPDLRTTACRQSNDVMTVYLAL
ncbi:protein of unknown function [Paraburkholderia dioscoreae]|uniref:Uncharacterized protein n=1 Tax=Paraburkholderia dioscoreae TaxID=2604047 RepID=A0A5Q4ZJD6_9BURK|nr:protein of unknown function [Paraburkholderia dioscoreae]